MDEIFEKLNQIVITEGCDKGVILLSQEGTTHYDAELKGQVYDHENFSPLGDALIELHDLLLKYKANVPPTAKPDWRMGLTVKPKYRNDPLLYERGKVR